MKKSFNLAANLRDLFSVGRLLNLIALGYVILAALLMSAISHPGEWGRLYLPSLYEGIILKTPANSVTLRTPGSGSKDMKIWRLGTTVTFNLRGTDPELASAIRSTLLPRTIVQFLFYATLFTLLRNLCARIETGEVFSERNLRSVRNLGLLLTLYSLISTAFLYWSSYRLGGYLVDHATLTGINATLQAHTGDLPLGNLITGLLVLLVAEAFRQGLVLKRENDLTV